MVNWRRTSLFCTAALVVVTPIVWIAWDLVVALDAVPGNTESEIISSWADRWPVVALGCGVVAGHWFLPARTRPRALSGVAVVGILAAVGVLSLVLSVAGVARPAGVEFGAGVLLGWLVWGRGVS